MSAAVADVLRDARLLITPPEKWTQGTYARTAKGNPIGPETRSAICWCLRGALFRVHRLSELTIAAEEALEKAALPLWSIAIFNDTHSHAEVLALLDRAEAAERAAP